MWDRIIRLPWHKLGMFGLGATGFLHELFAKGTERPFVLALCGALLGLPFVLSADQWNRPSPTPPIEEKDEGDRWSHLP